MSDSIHSGHRQRLKDKYLKYGAEALSEHELLEILLYYAIPQRNTNDIAHELIDKCGSLEGVFNADLDFLMQTKNIKANAATLISLVRDLNKKINLSSCRMGEIFDSLSKVGEYLMKYYVGIQHERVIMMMLDNSMRMIKTEVLSDGSVNSALMDYRKIATLALYNNASCVILAHNHPNGLAIPSSEDRLATKNADAALSAIGVTLFEHIIVGSHNYAPTMQPFFGHSRAGSAYMKIDDNIFIDFYKK